MPLTISRILHAGYVFACEDTVIACDTIFENPFSSNCHAFPDVRFDLQQIRGLRFDALFISHFHDDHCSLDSLALLDRATPIYLYCLFDELFDMIRALGFTQVHSLVIDAPVHVGAFEVIARRALDADVDSMFHIRAAGLNILNVVDAWIDPEVLPALAAYAPWDMVLWPFQTMREMAVIAPSRAAARPADLPADLPDNLPVELPDEWVGQLAALAPRYIVPSSCQFVQEPWSWYNHAMFPVTYDQFQREMTAALPGSRVLRLNPSVSVALDSVSLAPAPALAWVIPVGDQDLDFDYRPGAVPPTTAHIASHFAPLTAQQQALVEGYCAGALIEKYQEMELPQDSYFQQARIWQLSVVDHAGTAWNYRYRVHGDHIERAGDGEEPVAWLTEVPMAKCYAALTQGESLTSMYIRINDRVFSPAVEAGLAQADLVDDPLIRCLFNETVAAYQAAQLRRILARGAVR